MPLAHISLPTVMSQEEEDRRLIADKSTKESLGTLGIADTLGLMCSQPKGQQHLANT